jgi:UDP-2,3-diacylglucosamine pyrophosphatase LpxH
MEETSDGGRMKTLLMSDLHIGFKFSRAQDILSVLSSEKFDRLILVGDIFDIAQLMNRPYWDEHHTAVLKRILKIAKNKEVIYVIGNHDYPLFYLQEYTNRLAGLKLCREYTYTSGKRKILCIHGDQLDRVSRGTQKVGDFLYNLGLHLNKYVNAVRSLFGLRYWSISKWAKDRVKKLIARAFNMDALLEKHRKDADVIVYGHTHMPFISSDTVNTGTFVEIATYVTEEKGTFTLHDLDKNNS